MAVSAFGAICILTSYSGIIQGVREVLVPERLMTFGGKVDPLHREDPPSCVRSGLRELTSRCRSFALYALARWNVDNSLGNAFKRPARRIQNQQPSTMRIVIVGAGIAGLAAVSFNALTDSMLTVPGNSFAKGRSRNHHTRAVESQSGDRCNHLITAKCI